jgi:multidrug efflux system membrane fusion protein
MTTAPGTRGAPTPLTASRGLPARAAILPNRAVLILTGAALVFACSPKSPPQKKGGAPGGPVPVTVATAVRRDVPLTLQEMGAVEASNTVNVRARVGGELTRVAFTEGQDVRPGDLLFSLDARPYETALQSAQADSARDAARFASAQTQTQRYDELIGKDYVTKQDYDDVKANAAALRATLQADAAAVRNARLNLGYCSIRAPISGRTGTLFARQGSLVSANDPNPLVVIQQLIPVQVRFAVPEQRLPEIRRYAAQGTLHVQVTASDDSTQVHEGSLTFIDNAVDRTTGTILLKATFSNEDQALWPGQFVDVSMVLTTMKDAVVVPSQAVQQGQRGSFVYLIKPDLSAVMQPVTVALTFQDQVVVGQGVRPDDRVVTDGQLRLFPGAKVDIRAGVGGGSAAGAPGSPAGRSEPTPGDAPGGATAPGAGVPAGGTTGGAAGR